MNEKASSSLPDWPSITGKSFPVGELEEELIATLVKGMPDENRVADKLRQMTRGLSQQDRVERLRDIQEKKNRLVSPISGKPTASGPSEKSSAISECLETMTEEVNRLAAEVDKLQNELRQSRAQTTAANRKVVEMAERMARTIETLTEKLDGKTNTSRTS